MESSTNGANTANWLAVFRMNPIHVQSAMEFKDNISRVDTRTGNKVPKAMQTLEKSDAKVTVTKGCTGITIWEVLPTTCAPRCHDEDSFLMERNPLHFNPNLLCLGQKHFGTIHNISTFCFARNHSS